MIIRSSKNTEKKQRDIKIKDSKDWEEKNLLGFFGLLLKIDKKINTQLYKNGYQRKEFKTNK